jgi:hypothetical protein
MTKPIQEQIDKYNAMRREKYAKEQAEKADEPKWKHETYASKQGRKRADEERRAMLANFLRAKTPHEKRQVILSFNPYYFQFGDKLDPRNPYERNEDEQLQTSL